MGGFDPVHIVGWLAAVIIVVYFYKASHSGEYREFHWVNLICGIILIPVNIMLDVGFGAFLTAAMAFGSVIYFYKCHAVVHTTKDPLRVTYTG